MTKERLLFQKRDGDLAIEVRERDGRRSIELLRRYEKDGEWKATTRLPYADHKKGAKLLKDAQDWIGEQDKAEGERREAERPKEPGDWTRGQRYGQRIREKAAAGKGR
jgi:hypothetical protein